MSHPSPAGFDRTSLVEAKVPGFAREHRVRFQEIDAAGVVFHARFFEWFHDTWCELLAASGVPMHRIVVEGEWSVPLIHAEAHYLAAVRFGDLLETSIVRFQVRGSKVRLGYQVRGAEAGDLRAVGTTDHIFLDGSTFQRIEVPTALVERFRTLGPIELPAGS